MTKEEQASLPAITLLKLHCAHRSPRDLVKNADSDSGVLGRGPRSCMSNELPGDVDAAGP